MRQPCSVQRRVNELFGVGIGRARWRGKTHSASPILRRFRVNATQDHPSLADGAFDDGWTAVGILAHNLTPAGELRAILPVVFNRGCADICNRYRGLVDTRFTSA